VDGTSLSFVQVSSSSFSSFLSFLFLVLVSRPLTFILLPSPFISDEGEIFGWGDNSYSQLGSTPSSLPTKSPTLISLPFPAKTAAVGWAHSLVVTSSSFLCFLFKFSPFLLFPSFSSLHFSSSFLFRSCSRYLVPSSLL
jgi:hypothetical protein